MAPYLINIRGEEEEKENKKVPDLINIRGKD
jgi:hypothetical protein